MHSHENISSHSLISYFHDHIFLIPVFKGLGEGDACRDDFDGDLVLNSEDNCPENSELSKVDFRKFQSINLDPTEEAQIDPVWKIRNEVRNI